MNWIFIQIFVDVALLVGVFVLWTKLKRPPQDDPRLSRGLQLLQSKITVLEDLSDRTDVQVKQLSSLLDQKTRVIQDKISEADRHNYQIHESMQKSLEVAEIFQDKIPHAEIVERQKTVRYVKAARMAHSGASLDEIARAVDLPREQLELIAKVNKDQLMFDEEALPEWAKHTDKEDKTVRQVSALLEDEIPRESLQTLGHLSQKFKEACKDFQESEQRQIKNHQPSKTTEALLRAADGIGRRLADSASQLLDGRAFDTKSPEQKEHEQRFKKIEPTETAAASKPAKDEVRKVQFPRI